MLVIKLKKILFLFISFILFLPQVKADLTNEQSEDLALFASYFVTEGNKRTDSNGYTLLAYMQGPARIDGYQSKLYYVTKDYNGFSTVNANKWTFDCASFAAFVYYHVFDLALTKAYQSGNDSYSGLRLRNPNGNPYEVVDFVNDANNQEHFYNVKTGVSVDSINFNDLKKGDLIIRVGYHIMVYIHF